MALDGGHHKRKWYDEPCTSEYAFFCEVLGESHNPHNLGSMVLCNLKSFGFFEQDAKDLGTVVGQRTDVPLAAKGAKPSTSLVRTLSPLDVIGYWYEYQGSLSRSLAAREIGFSELMVDVLTVRTMRE